jgi:hypothetical protein
MRELAAELCALGVEAEEVSGLGRWSRVCRLRALCLDRAACLGAAAPQKVRDWARPPVAPRAPAAARWRAAEDAVLLRHVAAAKAAPPGSAAATLRGPHGAYVAASAELDGVRTAQACRSRWMKELARKPEHAHLAAQCRTGASSDTDKDEADAEEQEQHGDEPAAASSAEHGRPAAAAGEASGVCRRLSAFATAADATTAVPTTPADARQLVACADGGVLAQAAQEQRLEDEAQRADAPRAAQAAEAHASARRADAAATAAAATAIAAQLEDKKRKRHLADE